MSGNVTIVVDTDRISSRPRQIETLNSTVLVSERVRHSANNLALTIDLLLGFYQANDVTVIINSVSQRAIWGQTAVGGPFGIKFAHGSLKMMTIPLVLSSRRFSSTR